MTVVKRVTRNEMIRETGMDTLGYAKPQNQMILVRKGIPKDKEKEVLGHEFDHIKNGEEGPFWGAVAGAVISGIMAKQAADAQAGAVGGASKQAIAEQQRQFDLMRQDTAPYRTAGTAALNRIAQMYGFGGDMAAQGFDTQISQEQNRLNELLAKQQGQQGQAPMYRLSDGRIVSQDWIDKEQAAGNMPWQMKPQQIGGMDYSQQIEQSRNALAGLQAQREQALQGGQDQAAAGPDYSSFYQSPGYQFRVQQGEQGVQNYLGANKMRLSGRALKAIEDYRQGMASGEFGNYMNRMYGLAGIGQSAVGTATGAGQAAAGNISNIAQGTGANLANIYGGMYGNLNQAVQGGLSNWTAYQQQQNLMNQLGNTGYGGGSAARTSNAYIG